MTIFLSSNYLSEYFKSYASNIWLDLSFFCLKNQMILITISIIYFNLHFYDIFKHFIVYREGHSSNMTNQKFKITFYYGTFKWFSIYWVRDEINKFNFWTEICFWSKLHHNLQTRYTPSALSVP